MISVIEKLFEEEHPASTLIKKGDQKDMKVYKDGSPEGDTVDREITKNKFTKPNQSDGRVDQKAMPPNPQVSYQYVNTPLSRITKTRI